MSIFTLGAKCKIISDMKIIKNPLSQSELENFAQETFGDFVKAVVDIEKELMAVGGELHADEEALLLENGSMQKNLWGCNIFPQKSRADWIEFDSMINIRPSQGNRSREIQDAGVREKIKNIVDKLIAYAA